MVSRPSHHPSPGRTISCLASRSPRQEERPLTVLPHPAQPSMGQEPVHGPPDMARPEPAPRRGKAPGKRRGGLERTPPLASEQEHEAFVHLAEGGAHGCREWTGRHGIGHEDMSLGQQPELPRCDGRPAQSQGVPARQGGPHIRQHVPCDATARVPRYCSAQVFGSQCRLADG
jgi:hypothetical protein